jgi:hypothetical protein
MPQKSPVQPKTKKQSQETKKQQTKLGEANAISRI